MPELCCSTRGGPLVVSRLVLPRATSSARRGVRMAATPTSLFRQLQQLKHLRVWDISANSQTVAARGARRVAPAHTGAPADGTARPGAGGARRVGLVWYRSDLRLHDHEALTRANAECSSLLPVVCFDPREYGKSLQGYDRTGPYRATFLREAVADLRERLRAAGSELLVRFGRPEEVLPELARRLGASAVYCHTEVTYEEMQVEARVKASVQAAGAQLHSFWANTLQHVEDLPFKLQELPQNFDKFRERTVGAPARAALAAPGELRGLPLGPRLDPGDIPTLKQLGLAPLPAAAASGGAAAGGAAATRGGEGEALRRLRQFCGEVRLAGGGAPGAAYGSNFSSTVAPWLATGCLSPRRMLEEVRRQLGAPAAAPATAAQAAAQPSAAEAALNWVQFELLWRDFFRFITRKYSSLPQLNALASQPAAVAV